MFFYSGIIHQSSYEVLIRSCILFLQLTKYKLVSCSFFLKVTPVYKFLNTADSIKCCHFLLSVLLRQTNYTPTKWGHLLVELLSADSGEQTGWAALTGNPSSDLCYSCPAPLRRTLHSRSFNAWSDSQVPLVQTHDLLIKCRFFKTSLCLKTEYFSAM